MPTTGTTPASIVRFAKLAFGWVETVVSPVALAAIVKEGVTPICGAPVTGVGFESVAPAPVVGVVKMYPFGSVNCAVYVPGRRLPTK